MKRKIANVGVHSYYPAGGQRRPIAQIEAYRLIDHYILTTPLELRGRGITYLKNYADGDLVSDNQSRIGWNEYKATYDAFERLAKEYAIVIESLQD